MKDIICDKEHAQVVNDSQNRIHEADSESQASGPELEIAKVKQWDLHISACLFG